MSQSSSAMEVDGEKVAGTATPRAGSSPSTISWMERAYDEGVAMEQGGNVEGAAERYALIASFAADSLEEAVASMGELATAGTQPVEEDAWKMRETSIVRLAGAYATLEISVPRRTPAKRGASTMAKETAKIVRTVIDSLQRIPNTEVLQSDLCTQYIQWCKDEKRTFLRQRIEAKLAALHVSQRSFRPPSSCSPNFRQRSRSWMISSSSSKFSPLRAKCTTPSETFPNRRRRSLLRGLLPTRYTWVPVCRLKSTCRAAASMPTKRPQNRVLVLLRGV